GCPFFFSAEGGIRAFHVAGVPKGGLSVLKPSHSPRVRNINLFPLHLPLRAPLRGRLTPLKLALSRNPWAFGDSASHTVCRYSCQHSHFRYVHRRLPFGFIRLRNAPLPLIINYEP